MFPTWRQWQIYKGGLASTVINDEGEISPSSWNKKIKNENLRAPTMEHVRRGCRPSHPIPPSVGHTSRRPQVEPAIGRNGNTVAAKALILFPPIYYLHLCQKLFEY